MEQSEFFVVRPTVEGQALMPDLCEQGEPVLWQVRPLALRRIWQLRRLCWQGETFCLERYVLRLCADSVCFPDLQDAALQARYDVCGAEMLLETMLPSEGYERLVEMVRLANGYPDNRFGA